jgi:hypothetical protein
MTTAAATRSRACRPPAARSRFGGRLADYLRWRDWGRRHIAKRGLAYAEGFADGWRVPHITRPLPLDPISHQEVTS